MSGPLFGVKVVENTLFQQGPVAGAKLGDLGADVIKIEPKSGDPGRDMMRMVSLETGISGYNFYFENSNRNKRSLALDMKTTAGIEVFFKIVDKADVFLTNMSIDAPINLGLGPDVLMKRNPRLIYAQASGWGRKGPDAQDYSFDYTGIARSGLMMACGEAGDPPGRILPGLGDELGGMVCAWSVTAALYAREKTGIGQLVDTSLMGSIISMLGLSISCGAILDQEFIRSKRSDAGNPLYNHYRCKDDKWIALAHLQPERYWPKICQAMGIQNLEKDARFDTVGSRGKNAQELIGIFDRLFSSKPRDEWVNLLKEGGCICTPIQSPLEVSKDPQAIANNYVLNIEHPEIGKTRILGFPWDFHGTPAEYHHAAPKLGEHTDEILREAGYSAQAITKLRDDGVIA